MCPARPGPNPSRQRGHAQRAVHHSGRHRLWAAGMLRQSHRDTQHRRLAKDGLRYNNMHTTALCSPTRSCIMTGRNHHSNAMACITELATGYPGYNGNIPFENGFLSEMLLQHGYNTYVIGKWHLIPSDQNPPQAPMTAGRWGVDSSASTALWAATPTSTTLNWSTITTRSSRKDPGRGLPPDRRPGGQGHQFIADAKQVAPNKPFLPAFLPWRYARAPSRAQGVGGQVQGKVRRRLGCLPRKGLRPAERAGHRPGRRRTLAS